MAIEQLFNVIALCIWKADYQIIFAILSASTVVSTMLVEGSAFYEEEYGGAFVLGIINVIALLAMVLGLILV